MTINIIHDTVILRIISANRIKLLNKMHGTTYETICVCAFVCVDMHHILFKMHLIRIKRKPHSKRLS